MGAPVLDGQRALDEVAEVEAVIAAPVDLPVEEADPFAGQDVGVADVAIAVQQLAGPRATVAT